MLLFVIIYTIYVRKEIKLKYISLYGGDGIKKMDINEFVQKVTEAPFYTLLFGGGGILAIFVQIIVAKIKKKKSNDKDDKKTEPTEPFVIKIETPPQLPNNYYQSNYSNQIIYNPTEKDKESNKAWKTNRIDTTKENTKKISDFHSKEYYVNLAVSITKKQKPGDEFNYVQNNE